MDLTVKRSTSLRRILRRTQMGMVLRIPWMTVLMRKETLLTGAAAIGGLVIGIAEHWKIETVVKKEAEIPDKKRDLAGK